MLKGQQAGPCTGARGRAPWFSAFHHKQEAEGTPLSLLLHPSPYLPPNTTLLINLSFLEEKISYIPLSEGICHISGSAVRSLWSPCLLGGPRWREGSGDGRQTHPALLTSYVLQQGLALPTNAAFAALFLLCPSQCGNALGAPCCFQQSVTFHKEFFFKAIKKGLSLNHQELRICLNHGKFSKIFFFPPSPEGFASQVFAFAACTGANQLVAFPCRRTR